jgi:exosortase
MVNLVKTQSQSAPTEPTSSTGSTSQQPRSARFVGPVTLGLFSLVLLGWAFWPTLQLLSKTWSSNPEYNHGFLVPLFSLLILWSRRAQWESLTFQPVSLVAVFFFILLAILRLAAALMGIDYLDNLALIAGLFGIAALVGGWSAVRWAWPALLFLLFMIPLPFTVAHGLSGSLRSIATLSSAYFLQTFGFPVVTEGHVLLLGEHQIAVAEACSGLSMLYVFVAIAAGMAIYLKRPWFDRLILLLSSFPIAILANCIRIAVTAFAFQVAGKEMGEYIFHDLAGWIMMPLALGMIWLMLKYLDQVLVIPPEDAPLKVSTPPSAVPPAASPAASPGAV